MNNISSIKKHCKAISMIMRNRKMDYFKIEINEGYGRFRIVGKRMKQEAQK